MELREENKVFLFPPLIPPSHPVMTQQPLNSFIFNKITRNLKRLQINERKVENVLGGKCNEQKKGCTPKHQGRHAWW